MLSGIVVALAFAGLVQAVPNRRFNRAHPDILTPPDRTIRVCTKPDAFFTPAVSSPNGRDSGFLMDLLERFTKETGIKFSVQSHPDWIYDRMNEDNTWDNTFIGGLLSDQCDMVGPDMTVNSDAEKVVDFLTPIMPYKLELIYNPAFNLPWEPPVSQYIIQDSHDLVFLKNSKNSTLRDIYNSIASDMPESLVDSDDAAVKMVAGGNFAYVVESNFAQDAVARGGFPTDQVAIAPGDIGKYFYNTFAVQIGTKSEIGKDLRQDLDVVLERLNEEGVIQQLLTKYHVGLEL